MKHFLISVCGYPSIAEWVSQLETFAKEKEPSFPKPIKTCLDAFIANLTSTPQERLRRYRFTSG